jgi:hypothetical protein
MREPLICMLGKKDNHSELGENEILDSSGVSAAEKAVFCFSLSLSLSLCLGFCY